MHEMLLKGALSVLLLAGIMLAGCTMVNPGVDIQAHTLNFTTDTGPVPKPTLFISNTIPFSSLPDVSIEPIPGMVVNISSSNKSLQIEPRDDSPIVPPPVSERPLFTTFHVGDSANDGNTRITLNSVRYNNSFRLEPYNREGELNSQRPGYRLMALNITIRDLGALKDEDEGLFNGVVIKDSRGQRYTPVLSFISDREETSQGRTGYLFYEVPVSLSGMTLNYHFPDEIGIVAKFDLPL